MPLIKRRKPKIAISTWAHSGYISALKTAGADILVVDGETTLKAFDRCSGLLIPGGRDVGSYWYNEKPDKHTQPSDFDRDSLEIALVKRALKNNMSVLGVCRGHQLLNVALGGSLFQHIHGHEASGHAVSFEGSRTLGFLGHKVKLNSYHHQAVNELGEDLKVIAVTKDGTIEAIESTVHNWVVGVQFHPEMLQHRQDMCELVRRFVHAA